MKEKRSKTGNQSKFDKLYNERSKPCDRIQQLEIDNTDLSNKLTADTSISSSYDYDSDESVGSFQSVSSMFQKMVFRKQTMKSNFSKPDQINTPKSFYVKSADKSANHFQKSPTQSPWKDQMVWVVKGSLEEAKLHRADKKKNRASRGFTECFLANPEHFLCSSIPRSRDSQLSVLRVLYLVNFRKMFVFQMSKFSNIVSDILDLVQTFLSHLLGQMAASNSPNVQMNENSVHEAHQEHSIPSSRITVHPPSNVNPDMLLILPSDMVPQTVKNHKFEFKLNINPLVNHILQNHPLNKALYDSADVLEIYVQQAWKTIHLTHITVGQIRCPVLRVNVDFYSTDISVELLRRSLEFTEANSREGRTEFDDLPTKETALTRIREMGYLSTGA
ncbi:hypothetical protein L6452_19069 [Arctium lappa]|uniref:Uncharacterized protein n=1 Tax=Arctium lappa TaxID=4217 RepID=A0ACB9B6V6_ARCLA|nr:hypothetical protein L6452_19069 [Arctium lappa]